MVYYRVICDKLKQDADLQKELSLFKCYLSSKTEYWSASGYDFNVGKLQVGIPDESCFGPLLSLIYISDLPKSSKQTLWNCQRQ